MLQECETEMAAENHFQSSVLTAEGLAAYPDILRRAIIKGNEVTFGEELTRQDYWMQQQTYNTRNGPRRRRVNYTDAARRLAVTEFNTWYVRGLARRLIDEGITECEVYRAEIAREPRGECQVHEGAHYSVQEIYDGHRARYWPQPGNPEALSIPVGPNCHHTIRRAS